MAASITTDQRNLENGASFDNNIDHAGDFILLWSSLWGGLELNSMVDAPDISDFADVLSPPITAYGYNAKRSTRVLFKL